MSGPRREEQPNGDAAPGSERRPAAFRPRVAALIVALAFLARLAPLALPFEFTGPDTVTYVAPAVSLAEQGRYLDEAGRPTADRPPGYPAFLASVFLVAGGPSLLAVRVVQAALGALAALAVYLVLLREGPRAAVIGGLLAACDPIAIGQSPFVLREALLLGLTSALVLVLARVRGRGRYLLAALLLAALGLTHQLYLLLGAFLAGADLLAAWRRGARWRPLLVRVAVPWAAVALLVLLAGGLWARRNERLLGRLSLTATANAVPARELYLSVAYRDWWLSGDPATNFQAEAFAEERRLVDQHGVPAAKREYYRRTWTMWREHPLRSLGRVLRLNALYWLEIPGAVRLVDHPRLFVARWLLVPFHWVRLCCALAGVWWLVRRGGWVRQRHAIAALAFLALAPAALYPVPRYLAPGAPLLDLLASVGLVTALEARARRRAETLEVRP